MMVIIILLLLFTAMQYSFATNQKKRVAILDFNAENTSKTYANAVRNLFEVALHKENAVEILERNQMESILKEQGFSLTGCTDSSCAVQIGKLLSADMVVMGSLNKLGRYTVATKFVSVSRGNIAFAESVEAVSEEDLRKEVGTLAVRVSDKIMESELQIHLRDRKRFGIVIRGSYAIPIGNFEKYINPSVAGNLLGEFSFCSTYMFDFLTVAGGGYLSHDEDTNSINPKKLILMMGWAGPAVRLNLPWRINIQMNLLGGYSRTSLDSGSEDYPSNDPALLGDIELRYAMYRGFFLSIHTSYLRIFYTGVDLVEGLAGAGVGYSL